MTTITIRDVPEETHAELVARAAKKGQSLQDFVLALLIARTNKPEMEDLIARIEKRVKTSGAHLTTEQILEFRDAGRR